MHDMHWNVIVGNFNSREIEAYNIFDHGGFMDDVTKAYKRHRDDFGAFCEDVRRSLAYYFWSKCEWEVVVDHWPHSDRRKPKKVDVYYQVMLNWDVFIDYVWRMCRTRKNAKMAR